MKLKTIIVLPVLAAAMASISTACRNASATTTSVSGQKILYYTCSMHPSINSDKPGKCSRCGTALTAVHGNDAATNTVPDVSAKLVPYPLDICIVSGEKLGEMGAPVVSAYQGQEIKFCCPNCKATFLQDPDGYLKKIQAAAAKK